VGATVVGCTWYLTRLARGPSGEPSPIFYVSFSEHRVHFLSRLDQVQSYPLERREAGRKRQDDGRQSEVRKEVRLVAARRWHDILLMTRCSQLVARQALKSGCPLF
jgi:hypothetical protein